jgi:hypothetical protein
MATEEIELDGGTWSVEISADGACHIRDQHGARIHVSDSHQSAAVHLAMAISKLREMRREIRDWQAWGSKE